MLTQSVKGRGQEPATLKGIASPEYTHAQKAREDMLKASWRKVKAEHIVAGW